MIAGSTIQGELSSCRQHLFFERAGNLYVQLCSGSTLRVTFQPTGRLTNRRSPLPSFMPPANERRRRVYVSQSGSAK